MMRYYRVAILLLLAAFSTSSFGSCQEKVIEKRYVHILPSPGKQLLEVWRHKRGNVCYASVKIMSHGKQLFNYTMKSGGKKADYEISPYLEVFIIKSTKRDFIGILEGKPAGMFQFTTFKVFGYSQSALSIWKFFSTRGQGAEEGFEVNPVSNGFKISGAYVGRNQCEACATPVEATWLWNSEGQQFILSNPSLKTLIFSSVLLNY